MHLNLLILKCCLRANSFHLWMFLLFSLCKHLAFYIPNTSAFKFVSNVHLQHRHSLNAHWTGWIQAPGMSKDDGLKHDSQPLLIGSWTPSFFLAYNASAVSRCIYICLCDRPPGTRSLVDLQSAAERFLSSYILTLIYK